MPDIMIARLALRPMMSGNTNVAPNIATTCWAPSPTVLGQDSRSSGLTTAPGGGVEPSPYNFQPNAMPPPRETLRAAPIGAATSVGEADRKPREQAHKRHRRDLTGNARGGWQTSTPATLGRGRQSPCWPMLIARNATISDSRRDGSVVKLPSIRSSLPIR